MITNIAQAVGRMIDRAHPGLGYAIIIATPHTNDPKAMHTACTCNLLPEIAAPIMLQAGKTYQSRVNGMESN